jgi:hypothetical protein
MLGLINARSVMNKSDAIRDHIIDNELDILAITETWVPASCSDKDPLLQDLCPTGYTLTHVPRKARRGGGVAVIYREGFKRKTMPLWKAESFESLEITVTNSAACIRLIVIYRPPPSAKNGFTKAKFFQEFEHLLDHHNTTTGKLIILGDFNFHWEQHNDADKIHMQQLLDSAGLQQQVTGAPHTSGHCLDLVISRGPDNLITSTCVSSLLSDHHAIHCCLSLKKMPLPRKTVTYRKYKAIDHELFRKDLSLTPLIVSPATSLDELLMQYSTSLQDLINEHAPLKTKVTALRPSVPWFTADIAQAKRQRQKCEEKWRKTGLTVHREAYKHQRDCVNDLVAKAKKLHYNKQVEECPDQKALFRLLNTLLHRELKPQLPSNESLEELLQKFSDFFKSKISKIRLSLDSTPVDMSVFPLIPEFHPSSHLMSLQPLSEQEVIKLIKASPSKSCSLDPLPTFMLKEHVDLIAPAITSIINMSLSSAEVPLSMKMALVKPLLKKATLDPEN